MKKQAAGKKSSKNTTGWLYAAAATVLIAGRRHSNDSISALTAAFFLAEAPKPAPKHPAPKVSKEPSGSAGDCKVYEGLPSAKVRVLVPVTLSQDFFKEFVQKGEPVIIRNAMNSNSWRTVQQTWTKEYLKEHFADVRVLGGPRLFWPSDVYQCP